MCAHVCVLVAGVYGRVCVHVQICAVVAARGPRAAATAQVEGSRGSAGACLSPAGTVLCLAPEGGPAWGAAQVLRPLHPRSQDGRALRSPW